VLTVGDALRANALKWPDRPCLADPTRRLTFSEVNARVNRLAHGLRAFGCAPTDVIAIYARNSIEYLEMFHACAKLGLRFVTLNFWHRLGEMEVLLNHSEASWLVIDEADQERIAELRSRLPNLRGLIVIGTASVEGAHSWNDILARGHAGEPGVPVDKNAPFWMMYTSGTTGSPKGLYRSFLRTSLCLWAGMIEFGFRPSDAFLAVSPFFHGVTFLPLMVLQTGGSVYVLSEFVPEQVFSIIEQDKITCGFMVPTTLSMLMSHARYEAADFRSLRMLVTGGSALPTSVKTNIMRKMGPVLHEFYGASESGFITVLHPEDQLRKERCCGQPAFGAEVEIRGENGRPVLPGEVGEVFTRCEGRFDAYFKDVERTDAAVQQGWFTAGDLGRMDEQGFVYIVDRKSDLIISGGENIYPREIEDVLRNHPAIADCAVVGVADDLWGESVKAVVVTHIGSSLAAGDVIEHCSAHLAGFKRPKHVEFASALPKNASGKVLKAQLRDQP
jgi:long-chain acyl-CoA synthetase